MKRGSQFLSSVLPFPSTLISKALGILTNDRDLENLVKLPHYFLAIGNLTSEKDAITLALPPDSGLPHKTSQTLLAHKGIKNSQTRHLKAMFSV